jgi:3D-(3,5/4)-trihydroxycyclohexane-1,2-dione acylhydrolase (decyclizing)
MQQIPKEQQGLFGQIGALMGQSYILHTPGALRDCMRRGTACVHHPYKAGPFYVLLPLNTQPQQTKVNLATLPGALTVPVTAPANDAAYADALDRIATSKRPVIKAGGGTRGHDEMVCRLAERIGAVVVQSPGSTGVLPDAHPQNMHVGGSKGSISGNYAMENADLLIAMGTRAVCQADCSGVGYPNAQAVININGDMSDLMHYANTSGLLILPASRTGLMPARRKNRRGASSRQRGLLQNPWPTRRGGGMC